MKKNALHSVRGIVVKILFFTSVYPSIHAQVSDPSMWNLFINSKENVVVSDTFRLQTFGEKDTDNWIFSLQGGATVVTDKSTLKIPLGSSALFEPISLTRHIDVIIGLRMAGKYLMPTENLIFNCFRKGKMETLTVFTPEASDVTYNYSLKRIIDNPSFVNILASQPASNTKSGYYMTDSAFAFGNIPQYSLFTGAGNWGDTLRWSHLPPLRNRSALIGGDVTIDTNTRCKSAALSTGSLQIAPNTRFITDDLHLYDAKGSLTSQGEIVINKQITFHKTFDEKGKWYFISFPFNVYPHHIDARFLQKDAAPNDGGNFFYVQRYNGEKRAQTNSSAGNWEVCPVIEVNSHAPLFEKNKGYLIALDEKASDQTLTFSSETGEIPIDFAKNGEIPITVSASGTGINEENKGWYLCGNPMPAPLLLSQIAHNPALDGYIYLYDGTGYKAYPIQSNYALPPFSAFFVKASHETELTVSLPVSPSPHVLLPANAPLVSSKSEPSVREGSSGLTGLGTETPRFFVSDKNLYLEHMPSAGYMQLIDLTGRCLAKVPIAKGTQTIPIHCNPGLYIIHISAKNYEERIKCLLM